MTALTTRNRRVARVLDTLGLGTNTFNRLEMGTSDGQGWFCSGSAPVIKSHDPTTGEVLGEVLATTKNEYNEVLGRARKTFRTWREVPAPKRAELVRDIGVALREMQEPLAELIAIEMGKTVNEARGEVGEAIHMCEFAQGLARQLGGLPMQSERTKHRMMEQYHPLGIVGIFSAFNFPVAVLAWNRILSLVCGNVDVWKPSSLTPFVSIAVQKICNKVAYDHGHPGVSSLVIGSGETVGKWMLEDHSIPLISFTGSTETGRHVEQTVSKRFGKKILELGGNNAVIVTPNANLDLAVRGIVFGAIGTAGQRCTTTRRVIAHESVVDELLKRLIHAYGQVKIGDPLEKDTLMGPLVTNKAVRDMNVRMELAMDRDHGTLQYGAIPGPPAKDTNFVVPAILRMPAQTPSVRAETFAPILYVLTYKTLEEAIQLNNDVPQGLSSSIFTDNLKEAEFFLSMMGSDCGIANVNCAPSGAEIGGAFGGEKETGGGREAGSDCWKQFGRRQTNTVNWGDDLPLAQGIKFNVG